MRPATLARVNRSKQRLLLACRTGAVAFQPADFLLGSFQIAAELRDAILALAALFLVRLGAGDPSRIPSALIGHPAPMTILPPVPELARDGTPLVGIDPAEFQGNVSLVNVWASWCVPCHDEVPFLERLGADSRV
jgi:thiol-disulfide isomerase/thioredoxin